MNPEAPQGTAPPPPNARPPRGALVIVAVGLLACVVAAVATVGKGEGEAAHLEWVQLGSIPNSKPVAVPGSKATMELTDAGIRATGTNFSGYSLFRVASTLRIESGAPVGSGRVLCSVKTRHGTEIAQTSGDLRATYPRSSEGLFTQAVPEVLLARFSSHGSELAVLEVEDLMDRFTSERGVKLEWPTYRVGTEHLQYFLPAGKPDHDLALPFYTVWKTTAVPSAELACTLTTSAGKATVRTQGALPKISPPIDEEEEEENQEGE